MFKILQSKLQQYVNCEIPHIQAGFRKGRRTRDQITNICWIIEKASVFQKDSSKKTMFQKNIFCFIDKAFDCVDHNKMWKNLREMGIPGHLTCLLRNLYAGQEERVRTIYGAMNWFQIGKGARQGSTLSSCLFNLYAKYIMQSVKLDWRTSWNQDCQEKYQ